MHMLLCKAPEGLMTLLTILAIIYFCTLIGLLVGFLTSKKGTNARLVFGILTLVFWSLTLFFWLSTM